MGVVILVQITEEVVVLDYLAKVLVVAAVEELIG
jgi:hypothetical protein